VKPLAAGRPRTRARASTRAIVGTPRGLPAATPPQTVEHIAGAVPSFSDLELRIGKRLRELRTAKGLSLVDLAKAAEISVGNLSEIERGLAVPSIRTFCLLSTALGIGPGWLLEQSGPVQPDGDPFVVRATARQSIVFNKPGVVKRLASPPGPGNLQMLLVEIDPGNGSGEQGYSHAGEECGIVFEGILDIWIDGQKRTLGAGDSFRFPSTKTHRFHNPGNVLTRVVWVTSPPLY
jgi:mannose-6-phosphate isomerase-like protein (cupin superfamily)